VQKLDAERLGQADLDAALLNAALDDFVIENSISSSIPESSLLDDSLLELSLIEKSLPSATAESVVEAISVEHPPSSLILPQPAIRVDTREERFNINTVHRQGASSPSVDEQTKIADSWFLPLLGAGALGVALGGLIYVKFLRS